MALVLDSGAFIGIEWRSRTVLAMLRQAQLTQTPVVTSAAAVAQVWRGGVRQTFLGRELRGVAEAPLNRAAGRAVGALLAQAGTSDVVDAHVVSLCRPGDVLLTSDPHDLDHLAATRGVDLVIARV